MWTPAARAELARESLPDAVRYERSLIMVAEGSAFKWNIGAAAPFLIAE